MRKLLATTLVISTMLIAPLTLVQAGDDQNSGQHEEHSQAHSSEGMMGNGGMMDNTRMQGRMDQMKQTMQRLQNTDDPAERRELMKQHRQQMHQAMGSMCTMMGDGKKSDGDHEGGMTGKMDMDPEMRRQMMQEHMDMMEGMIEQMKAHMQADQSMHNNQ